MTKILITGAEGQIGTELCQQLVEKHGAEAILPSDVKNSSSDILTLDVTQPQQITEILQKYSVDTIYHMAAILSATGEQNPNLAWQVNMNGTWNILECAQKCGVNKVFCPSSIAVFGDNAQKDSCPQESVLNPNTLYGITKVSGELLGQYFYEKYQLDVRGIRYPGLISYKALPGGGTTDYAVEIFYEAIKKNNYTCFVKKETKLPMMYMPDAIRATIELMETERENLSIKGAYNIGAMNFTAGELVAEIVEHIPEFTCNYSPDIRQNYADTWPDSIDDRKARQDWGWCPDYCLKKTVTDMIEKIKTKIG